MLDDAYTHRVSWQALAGGAAVISADGTRIGTVERVVADSRTSTFAGVVVAVRPGPGGLRFVDPAQVSLIEERRLVLTVRQTQVGELPVPTPSHRRGSKGLL